MAAIDLSNVRYYRGGVGGASGAVGNDWANNAVISRVARYTIQAPDKGAARVSLVFDADLHGDGSYIDLRYFIGTDPDSHANAGPDAEYTGQFALDTAYAKFTAAFDFTLLPGKTYYLWVFPASSKYGWYYWGTSHTMEVEGVAGAVTIWINGKKKKAIPRIYKGGQWKHAVPRIYKSGDWKTST